MAEASDGSDDGGAIYSLGRTLLVVLLIQATGYILRRLKVFTPAHAGGLGFLVGNISLPAILFKSIAELDINSVSFKVLGAVFIAKVIVYALACVLGLLVARHREHKHSALHPGSALSLAGLLSLCCTMSDDVGLGVPVVTALYSLGSNSTSTTYDHTSGSSLDMTTMLYILSALQAVTFNTASFTLLAMGRAHEASSDAGSRADCAVALQVLRGLLKQPIFVAVVVGLLYRVTSFALGCTTTKCLELPWILGELCKYAGKPFTPVVLLLAGSASVGTFSVLNSLPSVVLPAALVSLQSLSLPVLCRVLCSTLGGNPSEQGFAFVYGILPCANSAFVIAQSFGLSSHLPTVAAYLGFGKLIAYPYLIVAAIVFNTSSTSVDAILGFRTLLATVCTFSSLVGCGLLLALCLVHRVYRRQPSHNPLTRTLIFAALQLLFAFFNFVANQDTEIPRTSKHIVLHALVSTFRWAANGWAVVLAFDQVRKTTAYVDRGQATRLRYGADTSEVERVERQRDTHVAWHIAVAIVLPAVLTVPHAATCPLPPDRCGIFSFLPYGESGQGWGCGESHKLLYEVVYAILTLYFGACLAIIVFGPGRRRAVAHEVTRRRPKRPTATILDKCSEQPETDARKSTEQGRLVKFVEGADAAQMGAPIDVEVPIEVPLRTSAGSPGSAASGAGFRGLRHTFNQRLALVPPQLCEDGHDEARRIGWDLRVRCLLFLFVLRSGFHAFFLHAISFPSSNVCEELGTLHGGATGLLLTVLIMLVDMQGLFTFLLFGLQTDLWRALLQLVVGSYIRVRGRCWSDSARDETRAESAGGSGSSPNRKTLKRQQRMTPDLLQQVSAAVNIGQTAMWAGADGASHPFLGDADREDELFPRRRCPSRSRTVAAVNLSCAERSMTANHSASEARPVAQLV